MKNPEDILVGIDGGGSGSRAAISVDGIVRGHGNAGPANATTDFQVATANILAATKQACLRAGLLETTLQRARAHVGLAGLQTAETAAEIRKALPFAVAEVSEDRETTVLGALGNTPGSVVAIGTGSFLARMEKPGAATRYVGGWGHVAGDQASGAWLGRHLLTQALLCLDGVATATPLIDRTLAEFGGDAVSLAAFAQTASPAEMARFAPAIIRAAKKRDPWATAIIRKGVTYIGRALSVLGWQEQEPLCLTGGLGPHYKPFLPSPMRQALVPAKGEALDGALLLAARLPKPPESKP